MKIERLLGIITFLLNRNVVSGKYLAEKFEVSERTIQRDIESINMAGIPIVSLRGASGGYQILDHYRFSKQTATDGDLRAIRSALESWNSVMDDERVKSTLEKVHSIDGSGQMPSLSIDFGVVKENRQVQAYLQLIEGAIHQGNILEFSYTNASNAVSQHIVEPVHLKFKWYAWYLVGYSRPKQDYRIYKLCRMTELVNRNQKFNSVHCDQTHYFEALMQRDTREVVTMTLKIKKGSYISFREYFNCFTLISEDDDNLIVEVPVIESERHWFASLLSFGDAIEIMAPSILRERVSSHVKKILELYNKPDR